MLIKYKTEPTIIVLSPNSANLIMNVLSQLRILAGGNVFAGMVPAAETGCKSVTLLL